MTTDDERVRDYVAGLPDASGTFAGTYSPDTDVPVLSSADLDDLMLIEIDTGDEPNPYAGPMTVLRVSTGERTWALPVDHVDLLGGNRVRVWVRRAQPHGAE